ncbi:hypothetical protein [Aeromonas fluvialis]|nr:hypothetical protein [Aeromonas fluvialis]
MRPGRERERVISLIGNLVIFAPPLSEWRIRPTKAANDPCS